ncbi:hypothetical protein J6590_055380 [Homalodisca vitripennis]|nr:hypothetical protein J6590_055380 [Homalodisca vitripennis]
MRGRWTGNGGRGMLSVSRSLINLEVEEAARRNLCACDCVTGECNSTGPGRTVLPVVGTQNAVALRYREFGTEQYRDNMNNYRGFRDGEVEFGIGQYRDNINKYEQDSEK